MEKIKIFYSTLLPYFKEAQKYFDYKKIHFLLSGYIPKYEAFCPSGSFKDYITSYSLLFLKKGKLVVASAGNVARAFAYRASRLKKDIVIFTPKYALENLKIPILPHRGVKVFAINGTYEDAINSAKKFVSRFKSKYILERGFKNRYRILGLSRLFEKLIKILKFDIYFQAVSGGVGPISLFYACKKLNSKLPRFFLSQNLPYAPLYTYIKEKKLPNKTLEPLTLAKVLTNSKADLKYLHKLLKITNGQILAIENEELLSIKKDWENILDVEIDFSVAVTLASVKKALENNLLKGEPILVHLTGAGYSLIKKYSLKYFLYE